MSGKKATVEIEEQFLRREHISVPRNPLIFKQLLWVKYVEDVGGGTLDMIYQCREWGFPEPLFEYISLDSISRKTATTDLKQLVLKGLLTRVGEGKRNIQYVLPDYAKITQKGS